MKNKNNNVRKEESDMDKYVFLFRNKYKKIQLNKNKVRSPLLCVSSSVLFNVPVVMST